MSDWRQQFEEEGKVVSEERTTYENREQSTGAKIFEKLSLLFLSLALLSLPLIFFTEFTLVQSTCLFVISFVLHPTDGDRYELLVKGMAQDLANIRIHTAIASKTDRAKKKI